MIQLTINNYNEMFMESKLKSFEKIDDMILESNNFFINDSYNLISRIWSLIINLTDKYSNVLEYFKESFIFLETDVLKIFEFLYDNLDKNPLDNLIKNISDISFFCDSESMLWKYKNLINKFEEENENNNKFYDYFKLNNVDVDDELTLIKNELNKLPNLSIYFEEKKCDIYRSKLLTLQNNLIFYKNKGSEDAEITKLRKDANDLLCRLDNKTKNNKIYIKSLNFLKKEINKFIKSYRPTKELFKILFNKVNIFIDLIGKNE